MKTSELGIQVYQYGLQACKPVLTVNVVFSPSFPFHETTEASGMGVGGEGEGRRNWSPQFFGLLD